MSERVWTVRDALVWVTDFLGRRGDDRPRVAAEWLMSAATGLSRVEIYAFSDRPLSLEERATLRALVKRRAAGEPLQYVTGEMPFRRLVIAVERGVFIPRPETEVLVDVALERIATVAHPRVADVCTGSGCVAVSIAYERAEARVWATDVDERAVTTAARNAMRARVDDRVHILHGTLLEPLPEGLLASLDLVVANPPYVPTAEVEGLPDEILRFEPRLALDGGSDGLAQARLIADAALRYLRPGGWLAMELSEEGVVAFARELEDAYDGIEVRKDLTGRDRIVAARKREARQT